MVTGLLKWRAYSRRRAEVRPMFVAKTGSMKMEDLENMLPGHVFAVAHQVPSVSYVPPPSWRKVTPR